MASALTEPDEELLDQAQDDKWVKYIQIRNSATLDRNMRLLSELIPGVQKSQLFNDAVLMYAALTRAQLEGGRLLIENPDGTRERLIFLSAGSGPLRDR